ncbi:cytochrome P450 87A3-like [Salvia miltiorrhiza]|uniref:cytochrome P450 87A3-like n=1 Tax=Salvia miltiorrhiza TaxID=226208 RepID=UPI0025AD234E|nr:cytochrome P450 87A3-like [Salvia miltiorrhiza]
MFALVLTVLVILIAKWVHRCWTPKCNGTLPPGSMGLPLLGETLHFLASTTSNDVPPFLRNRMQKYGPVFKTSLVGQAMIVSTDADLNYFIFQKEGELFESWYPDTFTKIFGTQNLSNLHGFLFKYVKNMVLNLVGSERLIAMLPEIEGASSRCLKTWSGHDSVDVRETTAQMIFDLTAKKLISYDSEKSSEDLRGYFEAFIKGLISFPFNIPGTSYYQCLQGRKKALKMLKNMLQERRERPRETQSDFFDYVLKEVEREDKILTEDIALDLMFVLLFASYETTSLALTLAIKFLSDHPSVLKQLMEEHEAIIKRRENPDSGLTWSEYKSMKFTFQIINETLRLANIAPVIFRKAMKETKFKEYTIPAGWPVMVCPPTLHLDPNTYKDPLLFNPWRWEGVDTHVASRKFMVFGGGVRVCVGADFAKLQMAVFLHCLVTKYKWKAIKGGEIVRTPGLQFPNGYHIHISPN